MFARHTLASGRERYFLVRLRELASPPLRDSYSTAGLCFAGALPCILFLGSAVRIIHLRLSEFLRDTQNSATLTSQAPNTKNLEDEDHEDCQP